MQRDDWRIRRRLSSDVVLINQIADHIIASGGKRLRPMLHVLAAGAAGYHGEHHTKLAAIIEFIHTSTLLHDDVVDESDLRRGRKTANALRSEEHTSELQSLMRISYAVFCLKKKKQIHTKTYTTP